MRALLGMEGEQTHRGESRGRNHSPSRPHLLGAVFLASHPLETLTDTSLHTLTAPSATSRAWETRRRPIQDCLQNRPFGRSGTPKATKVIASCCAKSRRKISKRNHRLICPCGHRSPSSRRDGCAKMRCSCSLITHTSMKSCACDHVHIHTYTRKPQPDEKADVRTRVCTITVATLKIHTSGPWGT